MNSKVIIIEPSIKDEPKKTGAYARVSSSRLEQLNSYHSQVEYYEDYIKSGRNAYFAGIYTDQGITGTSITKRLGFQKMMTDARTGKLDRIITKSITRFGRNLTETLSALRELKTYGVSVLFEADNIDTAEIRGELKVSMEAFLSESESKTISQTAKWSYRKRAEEGYFNQPNLPYGYYRVGKEITVDEQKARIIKLLFKLYVIKDLSIEKILNLFNRRKIGNRKWSRSGLVWMLSNERYCGDMLLQKKYSPNVFPYVLSVNKGDLPQYYVYDSFPKIIERELYEKSLAKLAETRSRFSKAQLGKNKKYSFTSFIKCGECGSIYKRRILRGQVSWVCNNHLKDKSACTVKQIFEKELKEAFLRIFYRLKSNIFILESYMENINNFNLNDDLEEQLFNIDKNIDDLLREKNKLHYQYQKNKIGVEDYLNGEQVMRAKINEVKHKKDNIQKEMNARQENINTKQLISILERTKWQEEFDDQLFKQIVKEIRIDSEIITFMLYNDLKLDVKRRTYDGNYKN